MIRIAIIGQNKILRESLKTLLNQIPDFTVQVDSSIQTFISHLPEFSPEVVLLDTTTREADYPAMIRSIKTIMGNIRLLILADVTEFYFWEHQQESSVDTILSVNSEKKEIECSIRSVMKGSIEAIYNGN